MKDSSSVETSSKVTKVNVKSCVAEPEPVPSESYHLAAIGTVLFLYVPVPAQSR
jgi:hypothetical protein